MSDEKHIVIMQINYFFFTEIPGEGGWDDRGGLGGISWENEEESQEAQGC